MVHSQLAIGADGSGADERLPGNYAGVAAGGRGCNTCAKQKLPLVRQRENTIIKGTPHHTLRKGQASCASPDQVPGRGIVTAIDDHVVLSHNTQCIGCGQALLMGSHVDGGVERQASGPGRQRLVQANAGLSVDDLPVQVGGLDDVVVHQAELACVRDWRVDATSGCYELAASDNSEEDTG